MGLGDKIHQSLGATASPRTTTQTSLIETLKQCQQRLISMMKSNHDAYETAGNLEGSESFEFFAKPSEGMLELPGDNIRIPLEETDIKGSDEDDEGYDDDVLDRRTLKRSSQLLIDK